MQRSIINQHGYLGGCLIKDIGRILLEYATNIWSSEVTIARTKWHWDYESAMPLCLLLALLCFFWGCCMHSHWLKRQHYFVLVIGMGHSGRTIAGGLQVKYIHWFVCLVQRRRRHWMKKGILTPFWYSSNSKKSCIAPSGPARGTPAQVYILPGVFF